MLIGIGFCSAKLMVEMNHAESRAKIAAQFEHDSQQCHRIGATRHSQPDAIPAPNQVMPPDVMKNVLCRLEHEEHLTGTNREETAQQAVRIQVKSLCVLCGRLCALCVSRF